MYASPISTGDRTSIAETEFNDEERFAKMVNFMGDVVALDHAQHKNVVSDMHDAINQIKNKIQEIEDSADRAKAGWKGDANASFMKAATEWHSEAETLKGRLNALSDAVDKGGDTIKSMDQHA